MQDALYEEMFRMEQEHWWFTGRRAIVNHMARRRLATADGDDWAPVRVCELGCGTGGNLVSWVEDGHEVVGVEPSTEAINWAQRRVGAEVRSGSLPDAIDVEARRWNLVLMTDVLEHVEQDHAAAETAMELLVPGGILVATVPAYQWLYSPRDRHHHHFRRYSKRRFRSLFDRSGFQIDLLSHYNCALFPAAAASRLVSKWTGREAAGDAGDLRLPPRWLNRVLHGTFAVERHALGKITLPWGLSLIAVVRRESTDVSAKSRAA